eukprot:TRINITY_DN1227_c0_g1_i1.p1 TRINITY_DN1227_c0_g1~~TRINITY_DN1227_c0_g1_i1.p1  ORF type:complete len:1400 (-),score=306.14 TRINITY_DN1227_c0_g1_i1:7123-11322(-)
MAWLMEVYAASATFIELMKKEPGNFTMVFQAFEGGLYSKDKEVCLWTLRVFSRLAEDFYSTELGENAWQWFIAKDGGLEGAIYSFKKSSEIQAAAIELMVNIGKGKIGELFKVHLKALFQENKEYLRFLSQIMQPLATVKTDESVKKEITGLLESWLEIACGQVDNDGRHTPQDRSIALGLICQMWLWFPVVFDRKEEVEDYVLNVLMRATRDKSQALQYYALSLLFELLEEFGASKRPFAPIIYKALTFSLIELYQNVSIRNFLEGNFVAIYRAFPAIPIGVLLDPLTKQMQALDYSKHELNLCDFTFLFNLVYHPKFPLKSMVPILDVLSQIMFNDATYAPLAKSVFLSILNKYDEPDGLVKEYGKKFIKNAFNAILSNIRKSNKKKDSNVQKRYHNYQAFKEEQEKELEMERLKGTMARFVIKVLKDVQDLEDKEQNTLIYNQALAMHYRIKNALKRPYDPLKKLIAKYGDPDEEIANFEAAQEQFIAEQKEQAKVLAIEGPNKSLTHDSYNGTPLGSLKKLGQYQLVPYKPLCEIGQKAMVDIEKIKKGRAEKEMQRKILEEEKFKVQERKKKALREKVERRHLELGIVSKSTKDVKEALILSEGRLEKILPKPANKKMPEFELTNLEDEEDRDREAINLYMEKYKKLFRHLFKKYANTSILPKKLAFDALKKKYELLAIGEFRKLLTDHGVESNTMKHEDLISLFRLINVKQNRNDLVNLTYEGFLEAFVQTAIKVYGKPPKDLSNLPLVESVKELKERFMQADLAKGENIVLYTDPDSAGLFPSDQALLKELAKKVESDPEYTLPEGYKEVLEKEIAFSYELQWAPDEATKICTELLDEAISERLGVHFIEPVVKYEEVIKVKPCNKIMKQKEGKANIEAVKHEKKLNLPVNLKLAVAQMPLELREIGSEVAGVVEDIVKAVIDGRNDIPGVDSKKNNKVLVRKHILEEEYKKVEEEREKRRKQRHLEIKQIIEERKKAEAENAEAKKAKEEERKRKEKEREERVREARKKEIAERIQHLEEAKNKKLEAESKNKIEAELKAKEENERKIKEREAFLKKKRQEMKNLLKEKEEKRKKAQEEEERKQAEQKKRREKEKREMEAKLKQEMEQYQHLKEQREELNKFMLLPETVELFDKYKTHLKYLFEYYAKLDNVELEKASLIIWQYKTFVKFANQMRIIPFLLSADEINVLFKALVKERSTTMKEAGLILDYDGFLEALVRISVLGKKRLAGEEPEPKPVKRNTVMIDVKEANPQVVEDLLRYVGLNPEEKKQAFVQKLIDLQIDYSKAPMMVMATRKKSGGSPKNEEVVEEKKEIVQEKPKEIPKKVKAEMGVSSSDKNAAPAETKKANIEEEIIAPGGNKETWEINQQFRYTTILISKRYIRTHLLMHQRY